MGVTLAYESWGRHSRALLLLHGFTGNRSSWRHLAPALNGVRAIAVDLPGHGDSPLPSRTGTEGFLETLDALACVLDDANVDVADVAGYSMGARLALAFALRHRARVRSVVLESGSPGLRRRRERVARRAEDERWATMLLSEGVEAFVRRWEALPMFAGLRQLSSEHAASLAQRRRSASAEGLAGALRCLGLGVQPDFWPLLPSLRAPVLLVTGRFDEKFTRVARRMGEKLPCAWHALLDAHHAPHLEAPLAWADEVNRFLQASAPELLEEATP